MLSATRARGRYAHRERDAVADRAELAGFRRITGLLADPDHLPLLYPHTFGFRLPMAILTHPSFPVPIWGVLQTRKDANRVYYRVGDERTLQLIVLMREVFCAPDADER